MVLDLSKGNTFTIEELKIKKEEVKFDNIVFKKKKYNKDKFYNFLEESLIFIEEDDGETNYNPNSLIKNIHWGQLKLFLSEFYVLINSKKELKNILYIGSAPGEHIYVLSKLFENYNYYLYDSGNFDKRLYELKNVKIYKKYFDDTELKKWKSFNENLFLISDIRTLTYSPESNSIESQKLNEKVVWEDMKLQEKWVTELEPLVSLLKFRLPFAYDFVIEEGINKKYLDGKILRQAYGKSKSSETRLMVEEIKFKDYDITKYERKMYYHNKEIRNKLKFLNPINDKNEPIYEKKGLFNGFDDVYFTTLVIQYLRKIKEIPSKENVRKIIDYILQNITVRKIDLLSKKN